MHPNLRYAREPLRAFGIVLAFIVGAGIFLVVIASPLKTTKIDILACPCTVIIQGDPAGGKPHATPHGLLILNGTVTWSRPEGGGFSVDFDESPFQDHTTHFDQNHATSQSANPPSSITDNDVYKYTLTVDGKRNDPHVIIVGGGKPRSHPPQ